MIKPGISVRIRDPRQITWWRRVLDRLNWRKIRTYQDALDRGFIQLGAMRDAD